ncbi:MAG: hypothetical protein R3C53_09575 [Pirellulaceae bacterium]
MAILGVAFYFFDTQDARWMYNPWTYAIATPVALLLFSVLLSTFVSRMIEKSMQLAFLLSVLIHLLLLVYFVNIVIFSRMWPDVLDSFVAQREQLKRETLQANQYHRVAANTRSGRRPDYLKFVPTEHQPTEVDNSESPAIQLARSERVDLISPSPEIERAASPHLLKREQPAATTPSISQQAASLSRSELSAARQAASEPVVPESAAPADAPQPSLEANSTVAARRSSGGAQLSTQSLATEPTRDSTPKITSSELQRAETQPMRLPSPKTETARPRRTTSPSAPRGSSPVEIAQTPSRSVDVAPSANAAASTSRRQPSTTTSALTSPAPILSAPEMSRRTPTHTTSERRETQFQLPTPSSGDSRMPIARDTAGGTMGSPAPSSMRVQGPDALAAPEASSGEVAAAASTIARQQTGAARRAPTALPEIGASTSQSWTGQASLSGGVSGTSPSQLADAAGSAMSRDVAGLSGSTGAIERSALGVAGPQGALSIPAGTDAIVGEDNRGGNVANNSDGDPNAALSAGGSTLSRSRGRGQSTTSSDLLGSLAGVNGSPDGATSSSASLPGLPSGMLRATDVGVEPASGAGIEATSMPRARVGDLASEAPRASAVQVPEAGGLGQGNSGTGTGDDLQAASNLSRNSTRVGSAPLSSPAALDIDAPLSNGGLAAQPELAGPILPRRMDLDPVFTPPQIESQRFARQDVGGPLAAGRDVAVPKPAFQQRLERLQDRHPEDQTAYEPQTEMAIERGLAYLAEHQRPDGSWRLQDFDTEVLMRSDTAATGLALLAFQGAGYTHQQFKYADTVDRAIKFLTQNQTGDGDLYIPQDPASDQNAWLYSHGIASIALCEAYGMTQDEQLKPHAQKAIDFMVASQDPLQGGWRYRPGTGTDTSVSGWFMMAFKSGQLAGLEVPAETFKKIEAYLDSSQASNTQPHLYRYNPFAADTPQQRHGLKPTAVMTSVGLLMRLYFGWQRDKPEMMNGADYLLDHLPEQGTPTESMRDTYYWYYATQVVFHMGGERWERWHDRLYPQLIQTQVAEGEHAGSWDPMLPTPDLWARYGGRLYVTTMNLLSLEVSYRHLPLYEATAK